MNTTPGARRPCVYPFKTPPSISHAYRKALKELGLGYSLRARVEPAGLNPVVHRDFDGPSWAAGEEVMLRLTADFPAAEFILELDVGGRSRLAAAEAAVFVSLGVLPVGRHTLRISAIARGATEDGAIDGSPFAFDFEVFEPSPWADVASERAGFRVLLDPANASLESLLTGHASVSLYGPPGRRVNWRLETIDASGQVAGGGPLTQISLPMGGKAASQLLEIEPGEILAEHRPALNDDGAAGTVVEIFLYDTLAGGAGFSPQMASRGGELFCKALEVMENCPAACDASCYRCLRSFRNRLDHNLLDRKLGAQVLRQVMTGLTPSYSPERAQSSLELLAADLRRQFSDEFDVTITPGSATQAPVSLKRKPTGMVKVNCQPTRSRPRCLVLRRPAADLAQPKASSMRLRILWLAL